MEFKEKSDRKNEFLFISVFLLINDNDNFYS